MTADADRGTSTLSGASIDSAYRSFPNNSDYDYLNANIFEAKEPLVWIGRPNAWLMFWKGSLGLPVGLYFILFGAVFGVFGGLGFGATSLNLFAYIGIASIAFGLFTTTTPFRAAWTARRTLYLISDRRVIVYVRGWHRRTTSMYATDINKFELIDKGNDRGSIRLRHRNLPGLSWFRYPFAMPEVDSGLWGIQNLKKAVLAIRKIKARAEPDLQKG